MSERPVVPIPADGLLLHIGVHKTGSTALQATLRRQRQVLARHGVTYPQTAYPAGQAARSALGKTLGWEKKAPKTRRDHTWQDFAAQVSRLHGRVVVSAEPLCQADDDQAARVVKDLGGSRVHVVVGVRALAGLLPSTWQQYLKGGRSVPYDRWLAQVLADPPDVSATPSFWKRNDVPALLARWGGLVGTDHLTVIIADPLRRERVPRTFEQLLDLPRGTLVEAAATARRNRSMTAAEAEMVRQVNVVARTSMKSRDYLDLVRGGAILHLVESRAPAPDEERLGVPPELAGRLSEISARHVRAVESCRATVVGDPNELLAPPSTWTVEPPGTVPIDAAATFVVGALARATTASSADAGEVDRRHAVLRRMAHRLPPSAQQWLLRRRTR